MVKLTSEDLASAKLMVLPDPYIVTCRECGRTFDLMDDEDAADWHDGHDCED